VTTPTREEAMAVLPQYASGTYLLTVEGDAEVPFEFSDEVTLGRHLDNDLIVAGEDVADFHARIEIGARSVQLIPMQGCVVQLGDVTIQERRGLLPGDRFALGLHTIRFDVVPEDPRCNWALVPPDGARRVVVSDDVSVGRGADCALRLSEGHVSRHHAVVTLRGGLVWVKDLESSNGTFVNGDRVFGACRLAHGDVVSFDTQAFQLIGDDPEFTPVAPFEPDLQAPREHAHAVDATPPSGRATEISSRGGALAGPTEAESEAVPTARAHPGGEGAVLLGMTAPVAGELFRLGFGRQVLGRVPEADIDIAAEDIAARHAEIDMRPEGAFLSSLISASDTLVNGSPVHTTRLHHGDRVRLGSVEFEYCAPSAGGSEAPGLWRHPGWVVAGLIVAGLSGVGLWIWLG
jgi:pSer/pThr/pTyr-binding forkhead associated (FHA) protein